MPEPIEGGLLDRLVFESFHRYLRAKLDEKGWFDQSSLSPGVRPVRFQSEPADAAATITANLVTVTTDTTDSTPAETGSDLEEQLTTWWVTIYAQNDAVGRHLRGDCHAILAGKMPSIGAESAGFQVYDWRQHPGTTENPDFTYPPANDVDKLAWIPNERVDTDREHDATTGIERNTWYVFGQFGEYR